MPEYEITDERMEGFAKSLLTLWRSIGDSPPSLDAERERGRDLTRATLAGMLMAWHQLFGSDEMRSLKRSMEERLRNELGYVPNIQLESADALNAFFASTFIDWNSPEGL